MSAMHPTAIIESGAQIGEGVVIEPYAVVKKSVRLGDRVVIKSARVYRWEYGDWRGHSGLARCEHWNKSPGFKISRRENLCENRKVL